MSKFTEALERLKTIASLLPDDDPDKQEMLDVEGDYSDLIEWALRKRNEHLAQAGACKELSDTYAKRQKSFEGKADGMKDVIGLIMRSASEKSYKGISGTVSIKDVPPKPIVQNEDEVPDEYKKTKISVDKVAINAAIKEGKQIDGVVMDNGGESITIRVK